MRKSFKNDSIMIEKNNKILVLPKMMGLVEEPEPQFIVPQNSIMNMRQNMVFSEYDSRPNGNTIMNQCPHCENMAKNFLYLENLIRSNYNVKDQCSLCYSSLKYLQYVNKSISQAFGHFDAIVQAAHASALSQKASKGLSKTCSRPSKLQSSIDSSNKGNPKLPSSKNRLAKKKSRISKLTVKSNKTGTKSVSGLTLPQSKTDKTRSKNSLKKEKKKVHISGHNIGTAEGAFENGAKLIKSKVSDSNKLHSRKQKGNKPKRNKGAHITK